MGELQGRLITKYRPQQPVEALKDAEPESLEEGVRERNGEMRTRKKFPLHKNFSVAQMKCLLWFTQWWGTV